MLTYESGLVMTVSTRDGAAVRVRDPIPGRGAERCSARGGGPPSRPHCRAARLPWAPAHRHHTAAPPVPKLFDANTIPL
ncbi:hypothetical protein GCM10010433_49160 [Streptomyces pulveraceus]